MIQPSVIILSIIILGQLVLAASLCIRLNNSKSAAKRAIQKADNQETLAMLAQRRRDDDVMVYTREVEILRRDNSSLQQELEGSKKMKSVTFQTRDSVSVKRFRIAGPIERLSCVHADGQLVVTEHFKDNSRLVTKFKESNITGAICVQYAD